MSTIFCPHCDQINSDLDVYCASCRRPLRNQPVELEQTQRNTQSFGSVERNAIVICCALSLLLFFFPLLTIHVPIAGDQDVSGYDVFSKLTAFREKLQPPRSPSTSTPSTANPRPPLPDLPLSIQLAWLMPIALILAFLSAAVALISAFKNLKVARVVCIIGACFSAAAILHTTIMNSDIHVWMTESMEAMRSELKDNPFAGLAENLQTIVVNAFQIKSGWAVYALLTLLGLAAALGFTRVLSRLRVEPISNS